MNVEIANRLLQLRKENNLSQEDLALRLGVTRQAVSKWERAEAAPDTENLMRLAKLYDVSLDLLLMGIMDDESEFELPPDPVDAYEADAADEPFYDPEPPQEARPMKASRTKNPDDLLDFSVGDVQIRISRHQFPYPVLVFVGYLALGFWFRLWHPGWLLFLTIPLYYTTPNLKSAPDKRKALRQYPYPVLATLVFFCVGFFLHAWHPGWMIFLTIPLYYTLVEHVVP